MLTLKTKILELRKKGKTYNQIVEILGCSKSSVSYHCNPETRIKQLKRNSRPSRYSLCECGNRKMATSKKCRSCEIKERTAIKGNKTLEEVACHYSGGGPYKSINKHARTVMKNTGVSKKCKVCAFGAYVEVCHIKPIHSFPITTLLSEINNISNLVYLCPNHHWMLDNGLLDLKEECDS